MSAEEIKCFAYCIKDFVSVSFIGYELAYEIIEIRLLKEAYMSVCELTKLKDFPIEKIDTNKLYLYTKQIQ